MQKQLWNSRLLGVILLCMTGCGAIGLYAEPAGSAESPQSMHQHFAASSYLQAMRDAKAVLSRNPENKEAMMIMLRSMAYLNVSETQADAAIRLADSLFPADHQIQSAIILLSISNGSIAQAQRRAYRRNQRCQFNCQP